MTSAAESPSMAVVELTFEGPLHLRLTQGFLVAGQDDPTARANATELVRATRTPEGPATVHAQVVAEGQVRVEAWGPGAERALAWAPDLLGLHDELPPPPESPLVLRDLAHRARGLRLPRTHRVVEALVLVVLQQLVAGPEAKRAYRNLVRHVGEGAPGPAEGLYLPLGAEQLRGLSPAELPPLGVLGRQGETLRRIGLHAERIEEADGMAFDEASARLRAVRGLGPWSVGQVLLRAMGDADAVPTGDYNLPSMVAWNLAGEERADDGRMLELLEPYRGQRGRVIRWIQVGGRHPPRRGPRHALRPLPRG